MSVRVYYESLWQGLAEGLEPSDFELRRRFLLDHVRAGERVLDVGCGEGRFTAELVRAGASAVGVDVAEEPLRRARARHPQLDVRLIDGDGPWQLEDASFDVVWAGEVLEHVLDTAAWLSEARRVLRSGGNLLVTTPGHGRATLLGLALSRRAFAAHFDPLGDHVRFYSRQTLTGLIEQFGFESVRAVRAGARPGFRRVLLAQATRSRF
ncbi:MAG TPA: class I SAM-dependent methyltransferase [Solirubrobacteraceae bacterium]|nr:class I SAM-dependent methyltransferase [Solirubrobacteraceae bacterium]